MSRQSTANKRKTGKEQYYTDASAVDKCLSYLTEFIDFEDFVFLEPAGGTGEFIKGFQRNGIPDNNILSFDIEPKHELVREANFLEVSIDNGKKPLVCVTNPPFGRASSLAKKFFNHAADSCDYICFLVPKSWRKWSVMNSLDNRFHLVGDIEMDANCFYLPDGTKKAKSALKTVFQVWKKKPHIERAKIKIPNHGLLKKINKNKEGMIVGANCSMVVFGYSCGRVTRLSGPTKYVTTSYYFHGDEEVIAALEKIDFSHFYKNVAYVEALSFQEINYELNKYFNKSNFNLQ